MRGATDSDGPFHGIGLSIVKLIEGVGVSLEYQARVSR